MLKFVSERKEKKNHLSIAVNVYTGYGALNVTTKHIGGMIEVSLILIKGLELELYECNYVS